MNEYHRDGSRHEMEKRADGSSSERPFTKNFQGQEFMNHEKQTDKHGHESSTWYNVGGIM